MIYYFRNTGDTNWGTATNWSLTDGGGATGAVPTSADDAYFTSNSGNCTVNASARVCKTLLFSGVGAGNYSGTITMTFGITVSGNVTLSATMGVSGTANLTVNETSTLTSNGKTWSAGLILGNVIGKTYTLADNWIISGNVQLYGFAGGNYILNGNSLSVSGNLIHNGTTLSGTTTIILLTGCTLTQTGGGALTNNLTINGNVTISGTISYNSGTLTYTSGTVTVTGSTLTIQSAGGTTLNTSGMSWNNVTISGGAITLTSNLNIGGLLTTGSNFTVNGTFNINCSGGISIFGAISQGTGITTLYLLGGTWSHQTGSNPLQIDTIINGNITISGAVQFNIRTLTYTSGTVTHINNSTLIISSSTTTILNTSGMSWNNVTFNLSNTITLSSDLNINGLLTIQNGTATINGAFNINCAGGLTLNSNPIVAGTGNPTLNLTGGVWSQSGVGVVRINTNLNGNVTLSGLVYYSSGTLKYISGVITVASSTLYIYWLPTTTLDLGAITLNNFTTSGSAANTINLSSNLNIGGIFTMVSGGLIINNFNINVSGNFSYTSTAGNTITGTSNLVFNGTGTWSHTTSAILRLNTNINTAGTLTISGTVYYDTGTLTYTSGTVTVTGSTLNIGASTTLNTSGMSWNNVSLSSTLTLTSQLNLSGTFNGFPACVINGGTINCSGSAATDNASGTGSLIMSGTGSLYGYWQIPVTINTSGTITINTVLQKGAGALTYTAGTVISTGTTLTVFGGASLNTSGMTWTNVTFADSGTSTLTSNLNVSGLLTFGTSVTPGTMTINGSTINASGSVTTNTEQIITGTANLVFNGTGTWSRGGVLLAKLRLNTTINTAGTLTISGTIYYNTGTLTYTTGTVVATGSTIIIEAATTIAVNNSGLTLNNITATANVTFSGTNGFTIGGTFTCSTAGLTHTFASTLTYIINALSIAGTSASKITIKSSVGGSKALLNFTNISVNYNLNVTDINSSGGQPGYTVGGTLSNTDNWNTGTTLYYVGTTNFSAAGSWSPYSGGIGIVSMSAPAATDDVVFDANSVNNCTVNAAGTCKTLNFTGYARTLTITFGITVSGNVTLSSSMTITGSGTLTVNTTSTLTSNGKTWSGGLTLGGSAQTYTLADSWTVGGTFSSNATTSQTVNGNTIYSNGLSITGNYTLSGTTTFELTGGTLGSFSGLNIISNNISFNGNIISGGNFGWTYTTGIFRYISGTITFNVGFPSFNNCTLDLGLLFIPTGLGLSNTITLLSDLNIGGILVAGGAGVTINGTFNINTYGGVSIQENYSIIKGTGSPVLNLYGGIWRSTISNGFPALLQLDTNIIGNINITGRLVCYNTGTLTYIKGIVKVDDTSALRITGATTLINCDKAIFKTVIITSGITVTMNKFFSGSALIPMRIQSSTTANYTIAFQDGFEKITKFTKISNCTVTNRGQLLCITDKSNKGGNVGIRYINQSPNGTLKCVPDTLVPLQTKTYAYGDAMIADPNMIVP